MLATRILGFVVACAATYVPLAVRAQSAPPDSALIYEQKALAEASAMDEGASSRALNYTRRALAIFTERGDERGQARSFARIAEIHAAENQTDSALIVARRAIAMLRRLETDSLELAEALATVSGELLIYGGSPDSASAYWAESSKIFSKHPDRARVGAILDRHGYALLRRAGRDTVFRQNVANLDSAVFYYRASIDASRLTRDSVFAARSLGNIANVWRLRGRIDSVLVYRRRAVAVSLRVGDTLQALFDMSEIAATFRSPVRDRIVGVTYHIDSALVWYRKAYALASLAGKSAQISNALAIAQIYDLKGQQDSSRLYLQRAFDAARAAENVAGERNAVSALANWYVQRGFDDSTLTLRRDVARLLRDRNRAGAGTVTTRGAMLDAWRELATAHGRRGNSDSAFFWFRRMLDSVGTDSVFANYRAQAVSNLGFQFLQVQHVDSAMWYFRQLSRLAAAPQLRTWSTTARDGLGRAYVQRGDIDSAIVIYTQVVRSSLGLAQAEALSQLAGIEQSTGQLDSALVHWRRVVQIYHDRVMRLPEANALISLGAVYRELGLMDSALVNYRLALDISGTDGQRDAVSGALLGMAATFSYADNADSSFVYMRRLLQVANDKASPLGRAGMLNNLGMLYYEFGQIDSAKVYVEAAHSLFVKYQYVGSQALTLANLAVIRLKTAADDSTFSLLRRALAMQVQLQVKLGEALTRLTMARAFVFAGQADSSLMYARRAVELARSARNRQTEGRALAEVGRGFAARGNIDSARVYFTQAVEVMRANGFARGVRVALADMAELFRTAPGAIDLSRATAYYDSAAAVVDNARRGAGGEANELAFGEAQVDVFGGWARAWVGRSAEVGATRSAASALAAVERGRAQSLVDMITRMQSVDRAAALAQLRPRAGSNLDAEADSLLSSLRARRVAALTYLIAGDTLFTWLLTPDGTLSLQPPVAIAETELNRLVRSSRRAFDADDARAVQLNPDELTIAFDSTLKDGNADDDWKRLAALLLPAELTAKIPAGTPIVIVPHGSIGLVPFAALATRGDSSARSNRSTSLRRTNAGDSVVTLGGRNPLRFAPSFAALKASESRVRVAVTPALRTTAARAAWRASRSTAATATAPAGVATTVATSALVVGNPSMPYVYSGRWTTRAKLQPLPGAEAEARTIATQLGTTALTGKAATETSVRARMGAAPLVHFATHGLAYGTASAARRSFVAFAPDATHDGLLTMGELMDDQSFRLNAELVVLSACQSGLGDMKKAEGSVGLQRALLAKGARSVLVSLWNVDDKATRLLMEKFYGYWLDPQVVRTKAEALQMAQDAVMRTPGYAHPKYWAAFQLVGAE